MMNTTTLRDTMMSSLVGKDIELDAVGRQFEPYLQVTAHCFCMLVAPGATSMLPPAPPWHKGLVV